MISSRFHLRITLLRAAWLTALILALILSLTAPAAHADSSAGSGATVSQAPGSPYADEGFPSSLAWSPGGGGGFLAVGDSTGSVSVFDQDETSGALTEDSASPIAGPTSGGVPVIAWDSTGRFLVVAEQGSNQVEVLDSEDHFQPVASSPVIEGSSSGSIEQIASDPEADFLAVLDSNSETINIFSISPSTGALTQDGSSPFTAGEQNELSWSPTGDLLAVSTNPDGTFSFANGAPSEVYGPTTIQTFSVDQGSGALSANSTTAGDLVGVNSIAFSADGTMLAAGNNSTSVDIFGVDDASGSLTAMQASPLTLPDPASQIAWASSGDDLATSDQSDSSGNIDQYAIDPASGTATELAGFPITDGVAEDDPFSLAFQPGSGWLAVGESNSASETGSVAAFDTSPASSTGPSSGPVSTGGAGSINSGSTGSGSTSTGSTSSTPSPVSSAISTPAPVSAPTIEPIIEPSYYRATTTGPVRLVFTPLGGFYRANQSTLRARGKVELTKLWPVLRSQFAKALATRITVVITAAGPTTKTARQRAEAVRHALLSRADKNITIITRGIVRAHDSQVHMSLSLSSW